MTTHGPAAADAPRRGRGRPPKARAAVAAPAQVVEDDDDPFISRATVRPAPRGPDLRGPQLRPPARGLKRGRTEEFNELYIRPQDVARFAEAGWALGWRRVTTLNAPESVVNPLDTKLQLMLHDNHWEPVTVEELPGYMPESHRGAIERGGMRLMKQPAYLTKESRDEQIAAARGKLLGVREMLTSTPQGHFDRNHPDARRVTGVKATHESQEVGTDEE